MATQINLQVSLDSNVAQSAGNELEVSPFSITDLLQTSSEYRETSESLDKLDIQNEAGEEFFDDNKKDELIAAELLQYMGLPSQPVADFSLDLPLIADSAPTDLDLLPTDNSIQTVSFEYLMEPIVTQGASCDLELPPSTSLLQSDIKELQTSTPVTASKRPTLSPGEEPKIISAADSAIHTLMLKMEKSSADVVERLPNAVESLAAPTPMNALKIGAEQRPAEAKKINSILSKDTSPAPISELTMQTVSLPLSSAKPEMFISQTKEFYNEPEAVSETLKIMPQNVENPKVLTVDTVSVNVTTPSLTVTKPQAPLTKISFNKEQAYVYAALKNYQNTEQIGNETEELPVSIIEKETLSPFQNLERSSSEDNFPLPQTREDTGSLLKSFESIAQTNASMALENQPVVPQDATGQQLANHLNEFLNNYVSNNMNAISSGANGNIQSQFQLELASLKPEILTQQVNPNVENYTAQINVNPAELGPITAKIEVNQGMATITFMTEHVHVQQLMERHLSDLHDVFQNSNINLTSVNIHNGTAQDKNESARQWHKEDEEKPVATNVKPSHTIREKRKNSIIDTYA